MKPKITPIETALRRHNPLAHEKATWCAQIKNVTAPEPSDPWTINTILSIALCNYADELAARYLHGQTAVLKFQSQQYH